MKKGIIFDLDGVLVFTDNYHYLAWKSIAEPLGVPFDEQINNRLRGVSRAESLEIILENYNGELSQEEKLKIMEEKNDYYKKLLEDMSPEDVTKEVRDTLKTLKERGYVLAIGSSSKNAKFILEKVQLTSMFEAISDGTNITNSKPDPEVFVKAAQFINLPEKDCYVVEDAFAGIDAAKSANMTAIAIGDATSYDKADYKMKSFSELLDICK